VGDESFLCIVPSDKFGASSTFTFELLLNITPGSIVPGELYDRNLWVAIKREREVYLFARLFIVSVEEILDQGFKNLYLITGDVARSAYFQRLNTNLPQLKIGHIGDIGIFPIADNELNHLVRISNSATRITNLRPPAIAIEGFSLESVVVHKLSGIRNLIENLKRKYPISEIPKHASDPLDWSPYESFAFGCILAQREFDKEAIRNELAKLVKDRTEPQGRGPRSIETTFSPIDPDSIMIRRYINPSQEESLGHGTGAILKTEAAEKTHQEMLRDICKYLIASGFVPQDNRNIDLFVEFSGGNLVFEIKSANISNFYRQALKGAMQLQEYCFFLDKMSIPVKMKCLIIENIEEDQIVNYCNELLNYIGIQVLIYRKNIEWPNRLTGLRELL
jgi:hypothetical protein